MSYIHFLNSVIVSKHAIIACAVVNAATTLDLPDMWVTSGRDGVHMTGSKHYTDQALDIRTHQLTDAQKSALVVAVRSRLGADYDLILEDLHGPNEHLHIEFDPKPKAGASV